MGHNVGHGSAWNRSLVLQEVVWLKRVQRIQGLERVGTTTKKKLLQQTI